MIKEFINIAHQYVSGKIETPLGILANGVWEIFSLVNGNPETTNYGIRLTMMLFFAIFLILVIQLRTRMIFDKKHIIAFIGGLFLIFRIITMLGFEWGWQIGIYDDWILHLLSPPLEHFWNMLFFGCIGYFTLNVYDYYPGILKKILWTIPVAMLGFFIYTSITWKAFFYAHLPSVPAYKECITDWQTHLVFAVIALYIVIIAIIKYKKYHMFLSAFWTLTFIEHFCRFLTFYNGYEPPELATIFHAMATWALPLLILHFINAYVIRSEFPRERRIRSQNNFFIRCDDCIKPLGE